MWFIVFFVLAVLWGVLLWPDLARKHGTARSIRGVKGFGRQLSAFDRTSTRGNPRVGRGGGSSSVVLFPVSMRPASRRPQAQGFRNTPRNSIEAQRRRIYVLAILIAAAVLSFSLALSVSKALLAVHFMIDLALALYVYVLFEIRAEQAEEYEEDAEGEFFEGDFDEDFGEGVAAAQG